MDADRCISCGEIIPEGRWVCLRCEQKELKLGRILQTNDATNEEVEDAYNWLYENVEGQVTI